MCDVSVYLYLDSCVSLPVSSHSSVLYLFHCLPPQDAEGQLESEEARVLRMQLELTQLKQEVERRLADKEEETESMR